MNFWQKESYLCSVNYYMPVALAVELDLLLTVSGSCLSSLPVLFGLWKLIFFNGAGSTSFLLKSFHLHSPEVSAGFSVNPILTQISILNKIAAA